MGFVKLKQEEQLEKLYRASDNHREQQRAQALLLSKRGYKMEQLADLFSVDRDTVSNWFGSWEKQQISLLDAARSGCPGRLSEEGKNSSRLDKRRTS